MATAKTDKQEALRQMLAAYTEFPDPRLSYNIGRLFQQTGDPREAAVRFHQFLDSGVETDPERLAKARSFLEQAEASTPPVDLQTPVPPPVVTKPELSVPGQVAVDNPHPSFRPTWRIAVGSTLMGAGLLTVGFGVAALSQNGNCSQFSSAATTPPPCLQMLDTSRVAASLLTSGILVAIGGVLTVAIPSRRPGAAVASQLTADRHRVAEY